MDLNEPPPEFDDDSLADFAVDFCTQVPTLSENRQPRDMHVNQQILPGFPESSHAGLDIRTEEARIEDRNEGHTAVNGTDGEEVISTPQMLFIGQTFATKEEARAYYNSYAKRLGFSIRTGTTRLAAVTREMSKILYVCNKEGNGRKAKSEKQLGGLADDAENGDSTEEDTDAEEVDKDEEDAEKKKKLDGGKKRKRERMQYTNCKARMVVKLMGSRWTVIDFITEHNHDLVLKPSLKKFLRSHKGIPAEEKDFIRLLHGSNLTTGRIMQLMSEFYGSAQLVPYVGKDVSNFRSTIRRNEKFKDMQQALDHFNMLKEEDPEFFYKFKLDAEHRVRNLFWVDSVSRHAYIESYHDCLI